MRQFALFLVVLAACGADEGLPCASLRPGDVVISEVMPWAPGADAGKEWIELFNATGKPVSVEGLTIHISSTDGKSPDAHEMRGPTAAFGTKAYLVLGGVLPEAKPTWVDYAYGADITLRDSDARLWLTCGDTLIDEITWAEKGPDGTSRQLSSDDLSAEANDDPERWCDSKTAFPDGELYGTLFGTPGGPNVSCGAPAHCTNPPKEGDLMITELMADPTAVSDAQGEWVEVLVTRTVDLAGVDLGVVGDGVADFKSTSGYDGCATTQAGTYVLFAHSTDPDVNGGLPGTPYLTKLSLTNSGMTICVGYKGKVLDQVTYPKATSGASWSRAPDGHWCNGRTPYGKGDKGTPGAANPACP